MENSSEKSRRKSCSTCMPPPSHHASPTRNAYVPVPPESPVVSVSRKSHFSGFSSAARVFNDALSSRPFGKRGPLRLALLLVAPETRERSSSAISDGCENSGVEYQ